MAAALVLTQLRAQLAVPAPGSHPGDPASPDEQPVPGLGVVYFTDHYAAHAQDLLDHLMAALPEVTDWVGTVGVGIAASGVEYFSEPALAVMLLDVPPDQYRVFSGVAPLPAALPSAAGGGFVAATALVHADAGTPDVAELVAELAQRTATGQVFGGLSSASLGRTVQLAHSSRGALPGQGAAGGVFEGGLSGVAFGEGVALLSRVTQGCTPIGPAHTVTELDRNLVLTLDGEAALDVLLTDLDITLDQPQAAMARLRNTLVGLSPSPTADTARRRGQLGADVRVRHLIGLDPKRLGVAVADLPEPGDQLVFCERNPEAARADLMRMCAEIREDLESPEDLPSAELPGLADTASHTAARRILGAIYVSCAGRGGPHFGAPSAEMQWVRLALGDVPLIGFFASGEIASQQLYGYSGVLTVFVEPPAQTPRARSARN